MTSTVGGGAVEREEGGGLELSEGEAFFVLEDMFGGLLPPEILEKVFVESSQNLEEVSERDREGGRGKGVPISVQIVMEIMARVGEEKEREQDLFHLRRTVSNFWGEGVDEGERGQ